LTSARIGSFLLAISSAICSISFDLATPYGISLTSRCQPPPFSRSTAIRARSRNAPRPLT
jgi:hypothetical protein